MARATWLGRLRGDTPAGFGAAAAPIGPRAGDSSSPGPGRSFGARQRSCGNMVAAAAAVPMTRPAAIVGAAVDAAAADAAAAVESDDATAWLGSPAPRVGRDGSHNRVLGFWVGRAGRNGSWVS